MKRLLTICLLAALSLGTFAQDKEHSHREKMAEKFQADKVAFISQKMDLSVKEAEAFWPIYNEYSKASDEVHKAVMEAVGKIHKASELTDAEASAAIDALLAAQKKENELQSQYTEKFKKVLPVKKVAAFFAAEMLSANICSAASKTRRNLWGQGTNARLTAGGKTLLKSLQIKPRNKLLVTLVADDERFCFQTGGGGGREFQHKALGEGAFLGFDKALAP